MIYSRGKEWGILRDIFLTETFRDCVIFVASDGLKTARFPCHKSVLMAASEHFESMLSPGKVKVIGFKHIRPPVVMAFLEFVYFGWVALEGWEFMLELHKAAVEYSTPDLVDFCETSIIKEINSTNICSIYESAISASSLNMMRHCKSHFLNIGFLGLNRKAFLECSEETATQILKIFDLVETFTVAHFKILWEWWTYKCCEEDIFLTEEEIASKMSPWLRFAHLDNFSEEELKSLPECVVKEYLKSCPILKLGERKHDSERTIPDCPKFPLLCEDSCDCLVFVKTSEFTYRFPCHIVVLANASRVLAEMLFTMRETEDNSIFLLKMCSGFKVTIYNYIIVSDISPSTMYTILKQIYTDEVELKGVNSACEIYAAAHQYKLIGLIQHCYEYMELIMTPQNICTILECAITTESTELLELCKDSIWRTDVYDIMNSRAFQEMSPATFSIALELSCFNTRIERIEFSVLWKRGIACCCENKTLVTHANIWHEISSLSEYIDFNHLSDEERQCIPQSEWEKLRQQCPKPARDEVDMLYEWMNTSSHSSSESNEVVNGTVDVPLPQHAKIFKTSSSPFKEVVLKGNFILFQFSINKNAFLPYFSIFHLGNPMFSQLKSARIYRKNETVAIYRCDKDGDLEAVSTDHPEKTEITFRARKNLFIGANNIYTLEVNSGDSSSNLVWNLVSLFNRTDGELKVTIRSEKVYGLKFLSFLPVL